MPELREWRKTLPTGEVYYQCAWCPSKFSGEHDLELHLESFDEEEATHKINWERHLKHHYGYSQDD